MYFLFCDLYFSNIIFKHIWHFEEYYKCTFNKMNALVFHNGPDPIRVSQWASIRNQKQHKKQLPIKRKQNMGEQATGNKFLMRHIFLKLIASTEGRNFSSSLSYSSALSWLDSPITFLKCTSLSWISSGQTDWPFICNLVLWLWFYVGSCMSRLRVNKLIIKHKMKHEPAP